MYILCIDSSAKSACACIVKDDKVISENFQNNGLTHSQTLLKLIDKTLNEANIGINDVDKFAVTNGPGSFTGIRIGVALIKGLAYNKSVIPVPTLDALGYQLSDKNGIIIAVMDARCNQVYCKIFKSSDGILTPICDEFADSVDFVKSKIIDFLSDDKKVYLCGDGAYLFSDIENISITEDENLLIHAPSVYKASKVYKEITPDKLMINYLRLPQAQRELIKKEQEK